MSLRMRGKEGEKTYMNIYSFSKKGTGQERNRDCCLQMADENCVVIGLSDGAGSGQMSHVGAKEVLENVLQFIMKNMCDMRIEDEDTIRYNIFCEMAFALDKTVKEHGGKKKDYGATLLAVGVMEDDYLAVHLGDGLIGCECESGVGVISHPANGINRKYTFLTSGDDLYKHIRIYKGKMDGIKKIFLVSDGVTEQYYDFIGMNSAFKEHLLHDAYEEIEEELKDSYDDYSLICLKTEEV